MISSPASYEGNRGKDAKNSCDLRHTGPESKIYDQEMMLSSLTPFSGPTRPKLHEKHHLSSMGGFTLTSINSKCVKFTIRSTFFQTLIK